MLLINCEIELDLRWARKCVISETSRTFRVVGDPPAYEVATRTTSATFQINNLPVNDDMKFLENRKQGIRRKISWNKYRSEITTKPKSNNLDYLID